MGLETVDGLRSFCLELSNDRPTPGGGTASAAAGAMAASLLVMVCEITMKSTKHDVSTSVLTDLRSQLLEIRDELISLSVEDAESYDLVMGTARLRRERPGIDSDKKYQAALKHASDIPLRTATACLKVLEAAVTTARVGSKRASSDAGVAIHLAQAGFDGAVLNVNINLGSITDSSYVNSAREKVGIQNKQVKMAVANALAILSVQ